MDGYYLGLDMGTSTVGWAVTDKNYNLIRKKGKDLWGVREFEEAQTSAERRTNRVARRRRQRQQARIGLLKDYFDEAIREVDPNFYARLENSKYHLEDKDENVRTVNGIFADKGYSDKEYFEEYPTIFHLRRELIANKEPHDVRLVFLALLNMFKHRGHFLNAGSTSEETLKIGEAYEGFRTLVEERLEIGFSKVSSEEIEAILSNKDYSRSRKAEELGEILGISKKQKQETAVIKAICGLKGNAKDLFNLEDLEEKVEIEFSSFGYDEKEPEIQAAIGDDLFEIVSAMKMIYDIGSLAGILKGSDYLSEARIKDYEKHKDDLAILKRVIKNNLSDKEYDGMFRSEDPGSYSAYVNSLSYDKVYANGEHSKHRRNMKGRKRDDFYAYVKKVLKSVSDSDEDKKYILSEIELEKFMPKQLSPSNSVIPYQLHEKEMKAILKNACNYLPFLNEKDESGLTVAERIVRIFTFQIPYYVGPVTEKSARDNGNGWVVRKESGAVLPWNIDDKVDMKKTAEKFIERMVRKCTYINGETVLPKCSLMYERYCVLNEINNLKIDGEKISVELKKEIYNDLFKTGKVTKKSLCSYLSNRNRIISENQVSGIDTNINNKLGSYQNFKKIFGDIVDTDSGKKMVEDIIFWCTIYGDSKQFLKENIMEHYPEVTKDQLKRITGIKFKDWGRFSKKFLELQGTDKESGEVLSLSTALWETNYNLMELIFSEDFTFKDELEKLQKKSLGSLSELTTDIFDDLYFSAPVKKMVWQTLGVIREIEQVMGAAPEKIFIEMTRTDEEKGDKGRKDSRKKQLLELYKNVKDDSHKWKELIEKEDESGRLKSKKMYLYLTQMGKDMYTGKPIDLNDLFNNNLYDIDHIYPRHFVKDDSILNNLVLVNKVDNIHKSDAYPIESAIRNNPVVRTHWDYLKEKNLITEEKYRRLTGSKEFSDEQKAGFIARQLVETAQATKGVADILKQVLPEETQIVYAKARNVSDFRRDYDLIKSRLVNDFHHANDAYLNIVVGNVYFTRFTNNPYRFIKEEYRKNSQDYHLSNIFRKDVIRGNEVAWKVPVKKSEANGTIATVRKVMARNTPMITKALYEKKGSLFNVQPKSKSIAKAKNYLPLKSRDIKLLDVTRYGGYPSINPSYLFLVEHGKDGKRKRNFESVPIYMKEKLISKEDLKEYCKVVLNYENPRICLARIKMNSLIKMDGYYYRLTGLDNRKNIELHNAVNLCLNSEWVTYINGIEKTDNGNIHNSINAVKNLELYDLLLKKHTETILKNNPRAESNKKALTEGRIVFEKLSLEEQCNTLKKILYLTNNGTTTTDLKVIGGSSEEGRLRISGNITNKEEVLLINQSITGIYESKIDLKTI